jgi:hypothetical protein
MHKPTNYAHTTFHLEANFKCLLMGLCTYDWSLILLFYVSLAIIYLISEGVNSQDSYHKYTI